MRCYLCVFLDEFHKFFLWLKCDCDGFSLAGREVRAFAYRYLCESLSQARSGRYICSPFFHALREMRPHVCRQLSRSRPFSFFFRSIGVLSSSNPRWCHISDPIALYCRNISPQTRHLENVLHLESRHTSRHTHNLSVFAPGCDVDEFHGVFVGFKKAAALVPHDFHGQRGRSTTKPGPWYAIVRRGCRCNVRGRNTAG